MTHVSSWAQELTESVLGVPFKIGDVVKHPSGRTVIIRSGATWGIYGLSNWWCWQELKPDGSIGPAESGYGWPLDGT